MEANWKPSDSKSLINLLHEITLLHFKDFRRSLYGYGNYRLHKNEARYAITKDNWRAKQINAKSSKTSYKIKRRRKMYLCTIDVFQVFRTCGNHRQKTWSKKTDKTKQDLAKICLRETVFLCIDFVS